TPARVAGLNSHDTVMTARVHRANPVPVKQPAVIAHHAIHPLVIDAVAPALNAVMAQNGPNTTIAVGGLFTNNLPHIVQQLSIFSVGRRVATINPVGGTTQQSGHMAARHTKNRADLSHCSSPGNKGDRAIHFRLLPYSTASFRISFSSVLRPKAASNCRIRLSASCICEAGTTGSLAPTASKEPSVYALRHWNNWLAETPAWRATRETDLPGSKVCCT